MLVHVDVHISQIRSDIFLFRPAFAVTLERQDHLNVTATRY